MGRIMKEAIIETKDLTGPGKFLAEQSGELLRDWLDAIQKQVSIVKDIPSPVLVNTLSNFS